MLMASNGHPHARAGYSAKIAAQRASRGQAATPRVKKTYTAKRRAALVRYTHPAGSARAEDNDGGKEGWTPKGRHAHHRNQPP
jgi:hypothetical protein